MTIPFYASSQFTEGQFYSIEARSSGRFLKAKSNGSMSFETRASNDFGNNWKFVAAGDNNFLILNKLTSKVLIPIDCSEEEGENLELTSNTQLACAKWTFEEKNGFYLIKNSVSGLYLSVDNDYPDYTDPNPDINYANIYMQKGTPVQRNYTGEMYQEFEIEPIIYEPGNVLVVPQLGWRPEDNKYALLILNTPANSTEFTVKNENGENVLSGNFSLFTNDISQTWGNYYYKADISSLTEKGSYTIYAGNMSADFIIANGIYRNPEKTKGGFADYNDFFEGFWNYNRYYDKPVELLEATLTLDENGGEHFSFTGNTYTLQPYGWFDAHSRDSKLARTAKALSDLSMAYFLTENAANKLTLKKNIKYGIKNLLFTQNDDGSWPAGKIRDHDENSGYDTRYYHWVINKDVNTAARCVKALTLGYNVFKISDPDFAGELLAKAVKGWEFVINNENLVDENIKYRGYTADIIAAAIELAITTGESQYFDKADDMISQSKYSGGIFRKKTGNWPAETGNRFVELFETPIYSFCKYYNYARTDEIRQKTKDLVYQFRDYWINQDKDPYNLPKIILKRNTGFGLVKGVFDYSFQMASIAYFFSDEQAMEEVLSGINLITGLNPFQTSYISGIGDPDIKPSLNFFNRSFENGTGANLPGFFKNQQTGKFNEKFDAYQSTEGVLPISSEVFYLLETVNNLKHTEEPFFGSVKINEVKSNSDLPGASFIELYNNSDTPVNLSSLKLEQYNTYGETPEYSYNLSGTLNPGSYIVIAGSKESFKQVYNFEPLLEWNQLNITSTTGGFKLVNGQETVDNFNAIPNPSETLENGSIYIRKGYDNDGTSLTGNWYNAGQNINGTPGKNNNVIWDRNQTAEACDYYLWPVNGEIYEESGNYTYILPNVYGIDSVINLELTISIDRTVTVSDNKLIANETDASYQWLNCDKHKEPVEGATERIFTPGKSGRYAVRISKNGCTVVSDCYETFLDVDENPEKSINVYPNPVSDILNININGNYKNIILKIYNMEGKLVDYKKYRSTSFISLNFNKKPSLYLIVLETPKTRIVKKVISINNR